MSVEHLNMRHLTRLTGWMGGVVFIFRVIAETLRHYEHEPIRCATLCAQVSRHPTQPASNYAHIRACRKRKHTEQQKIVFFLKQIVIARACATRVAQSLLFL